MTAAARHQVAPARRAMLAKVHLAAKALGLQDEVRRDVLERATGHRSSADCTDEQLHAALEAFRRLGWSPTNKHGNKQSPRTGMAPVRQPRPADNPVARKARALWLSLWNLGVVRDPSERALEAFGKRQLGVDRLAWADQAQGYRLVEALKAMAHRAGWAQDEHDVHALKVELVRAQWWVLFKAGEAKGPDAAAYYLFRRGIAKSMNGLNTLSEDELDAAHRHLGEWIRRAKGDAA